MDTATTKKAIAAIELGIGIGATFAPDKLIAAYGMKPSDLNGIGKFGFRLFGIRNFMVGLLLFSGRKEAEDFTLAVQAPDLVMFAHAYKTGYVPKQAAVGAIATAGLVSGLALAARR